jgi:hypothetical protein
MSTFSPPSVMPVRITGFWDKKTWQTLTITVKPGQGLHCDRFNIPINPLRTTFQ